MLPGLVHSQKKHLVLGLDQSLGRRLLRYVQYGAHVYDGTYNLPEGGGRGAPVTCSEWQVVHIRVRLGLDMRSVRPSELLCSWARICGGKKNDYVVPL